MSTCIEVAQRESERHSQEQTRGKIRSILNYKVYLILILKTYFFKLHIILPVVKLFSKGRN